MSDFKNHTFTETLVSSMLFTVHIIFVIFSLKEKTKWTMPKLLELLLVFFLAVGKPSNGFSSEAINISFDKKCPIAAHLIELLQDLKSDSCGSKKNLVW